MRKFEFWQKPLLDPNNFVTIRIWSPLLNGMPATAFEVIQAMSSSKTDATKNTRVGHVTLETNNRYVSWWPGEGLSNAGIGALLKVVKAQNNAQIINDMISEATLPNDQLDLTNAHPDIEVTLYSLDINLIENMFDEIRENENEDENIPSDGTVKKSKMGYVLIGNKKATRLYNYFYNDSQQGNSCCGLAYELLEAGGIHQLTSSFRHLSAQYLLLTTDNFADFIKYAKTQEVTLHPETQSFRRSDNDYMPETDNNSCSIS